MTSIINYLQRDNTLMVSEGLNIFKVPAPKKLAGKTLEQSQIRRETGCSVIAIDSSGKMEVSPSPTTAIGKSDELILIGNAEAEQCFVESFSKES